MDAPTAEHSEDERLSGAADKWPLSARDAAALLGVSERTIRRAISSGDLFARKRAGVYRIDQQDIDAYRERSRRSGSPRTDAPDGRLHLIPFPGRADDSATLPHPLTPLIGREDEITVAAALLRGDDPAHTTRLLTMTGPGGVGKTRIAIQVAEETAADFPGGVWFVSLAPISNPALVVPTIAHVLNVRDVAGEPLPSRIAKFLAEKRALLVLDNFEQVVEAAPLVTDLLGQCLLLTILVTSRLRLRVSGEFEQVVSPLATTELATDETVTETNPSASVRLFAARASAVRQDFVVNDENVRVITGICRRLDGLPLAIELAAALVKVLSPAELLERLERPLPLLTGGGRDLSSRQQTMRDTIAWSYNLLTADEQALFRRLAVFVGGLTLEAVEAVAADLNLDSLAGVAALVDKSLLRPVASDTGAGRYMMLETIREYGLERLAAGGEEAAVRQAHMRFYLSLAERMWDCWTAPPYRGLERLADLEDQIRHMKPEVGNIRVALAWAVGHAPLEALQLAGALDWYWSRLGLIAEGRRCIEQCLTEAGDAPSADRARALMVAGWLALQQVDLAQADRWLSEALDRYREIGDPARLSDTLGRLGPVALAQGDLDRARRIHTEEHEHALASGDPISLVIATANLGVVAAETGDLENAELLLTDAAAAHRTTTGPYPTAIVLNNLANVVLKRGDAARAAGLYRAALATFVEGEDWADVMACIDGLANATVNCWPAPTVHLLGAMAALRERLGYVRAPEGGPAHERTLETARAALGLASFAESWAVGQERPLDDVIAEALALATALSQSSTPNSNGSTRRLGLTPREVDVLGLVAGGSSNREIADALFISVPTVKRHLTNILGKLGVSSRTDAAAFARAHGLD